MTHTRCPDHTWPCMMGIYLDEWRLEEDSFSVHVWDGTSFDADFKMFYFLPARVGCVGSSDG